MFEKKNFKFNEKVLIKGTNTMFDGKEVIITGIAMIHIIDTYIVALGEPVTVEGREVMPTFSSMTLPESNLERK